jgi:integrase
MSMSEPIEPPGEPPWSELVDRFAAYLEDEERSPHTVRNYTDDLAVFARWYALRHGEDPLLGSLAKRHLVEWKASLEKTGGRKRQKAALQTVNRKLAAVRSFFRWAQDHDLGVRFDPPKPQKSQDPPAPRWLEKNEERALVEAVEASGRARDLAILYLGLHGGLRVSEMQALDWPDVTISERKGQILIRKGKGAKQRTIKLSKTLRGVLSDWGSKHRKGPVLTGQRGRLSVRGIQDLMEGYGRKTRVGKRVGLEDFSIHVLRHTCARRMLEKGNPITDVAAHLGHSDTKTTQGYLTPKDHDLIRAAESLDED